MTLREIIAEYIIDQAKRLNNPALRINAGVRIEQARQLQATLLETQLNIEFKDDSVKQVYNIVSGLASQLMAKILRSCEPIDHRDINYKPIGISDTRESSHELLSQVAEIKKNENQDINIRISAGHTITL